MSKELYVCPNKKCEVYKDCPHKEPHILGSWNSRRILRKECNHRPCAEGFTCIPYTPEPELWVCDHAETCQAHCYTGKTPEPKAEKIHEMIRPEGFECHDYQTTVHLIPYHPQSPIKEQPMWKLIKPVSIKALEDAGMPERELHRFAFLMLKEFPSGGVSINTEYSTGLYWEALIRVASQCEGGIGFLLEEGFIWEKEEVFYRIGQRFRHEGSEYILAKCSTDGEVALINLRSGNIKCGPHHVGSLGSISQGEFRIVAGNGRVELITD